MSNPALWNNAYRKTGERRDENEGMKVHNPALGAVARSNRTRYQFGSLSGQGCVHRKSKCGMWINRLSVTLTTVLEATTSREGEGTGQRIYEQKRRTDSEMD